MKDRLNIGLAQLDARLGNIDANLERHLEMIARAREKDTDLLVFPELSLTGYRLLHLTARVSMPLDAAPIRELARAAGPMAVVVGFVEEDPSGVLYNTAVAIEGGEIVHRHRKLYLPTYDIFQEGRFFGAGNELAVGTIAGARAGILICEDLWHPDAARALAAGGARLLIAPSAGPGRIGSSDKPDSADAWEVLTRSAGLANTCWVAYCNRVGWEEGTFYTGGSHIVRPGGGIASQAPYLDEELHFATIDLREADRLRWRLPLVREWRHDIRRPEPS